MSLIFLGLFPFGILPGFLPMFIQEFPARNFEGYPRRYFEEITSTIFRMNSGSNFEKIFKRSLRMSTAGISGNSKEENPGENIRKNSVENISKCSCRNPKLPKKILRECPKILKKVRHSGSNTGKNLLSKTSSGRNHEENL